jgi:hypothetical protein
MRKSIVPILLAAATAGPAHGGDGPGEGNRSPAHGRIVAARESNICTSVLVDPAMLPGRVDEELLRNLSGFLASQMLSLHRADGGSYTLPGTSTGRFTIVADGRNPHCAQRDVDVFVDLRYRPRRDGRPFIVDYRILRADRSIYGRVDVDVAEEIRSGRIQGYTVRRTDADLIGEDISRRAAQLIGFIVFE